MKNTKNYLLPFITSEKIAKNIISFYFEREKSGFNFLPGQYIRMYLPHENPDERGTSRFFTVSSSPLEKKHIMITTRIGDTPSTFKKTLLCLKKGEQISIFGPLGNFVLPEDKKVPLVFLANGISITPYHSMLTYVAKNNLVQPTTLIASFTSPDEMVFYEKLNQIAKKNKHVQVIYTLTKSSLKWHGESGRISENLIKKYVKKLQQPLFYIVGSPDAVQKMRAILEKLKISEEKIIAEDFTGY